MRQKRERGGRLKRTALLAGGGSAALSLHLRSRLLGSNLPLANMGNVAQSIQMVLGLAKIDVALNMYFAAITTRMVLTGIDKLADRRTKLGNVTTFTA